MKKLITFEIELIEDVEKEKLIKSLEDWIKNNCQKPIYNIKVEDVNE